MFRTWLAPILSQIPPDLPAESASALHKAIADEALRRFTAFLAGVRAYQAHPALRQAAPEAALFWQEGTTKVWDYAPDSKGAVILVIPSLVNRFDILDIAPDRSFLRHLAQSGFRPMVVDWQEPGEEEKNFTLTDYMTRRLFTILDAVTKDGGPCHVLGYCMGGVLALALALLRQDRMRSLALIATPWDFSHGVGSVPPASTLMGRLFAREAERLAPFLESSNLMPAACLQAMFTVFQPLQVLQKFARLASGEADEAHLQRFILTEDWLNDGVPLSLAAAMECLRDWYIGNLPAKGLWRLAGQRIDPRAITLPCFVVAASRDKIVPSESASPLASLLPKATLLEPALGHIGLMAGDAAPQEVWNPLVLWLKKLRT